MENEVRNRRKPHLRAFFLLTCSASCDYDGFPWCGTVKFILSLSACIWMKQTSDLRLCKCFPCIITCASFIPSLTVEDGRLSYYKHGDAEWWVVDDCLEQVKTPKASVGGFISSECPFCMWEIREEFKVPLMRQKTTHFKWHFSRYCN